jgi:hypothetical protein
MIRKEIPVLKYEFPFILTAFECLLTEYNRQCRYKNAKAKTLLSNYLLCSGRPEKQT